MSNYNRWDHDLKNAIKALDTMREFILPELISGKIHSVESSDNGILILDESYII